MSFLYFFPVFSPTLEPDAVVDYFQCVSHSIVLSHLHFLSFCRETNKIDCLWQFTYSQLFNWFCPFFWQYIKRKYAWSAWIIKVECQTANVIKRNISDSLRKQKVFLRTHLHNQGLVVIRHRDLHLKDHILTYWLTPCRTFCCENKYC